MAYIRPSNESPVSHEVLGTLARLLGLTLPDADLEPLSTALRDQLASVQAFEMLDLTGVSPAVEFDASWDD